MPQIIKTRTTVYNITHVKVDFPYLMKLGVTFAAISNTKASGVMPATNLLTTEIKSA